MENDEEREEQEFLSFYVKYRARRQEMLLKFIEVIAKYMAAPAVTSGGTLPAVNYRSILSQKDY